MTHSPTNSPTLIHRYPTHSLTNPPSHCILSHSLIHSRQLAATPTRTHPPVPLSLTYRSTHPLPHSLPHPFTSATYKYTLSHSPVPKLTQTFSLTDRLREIAMAYKSHHFSSSNEREREEREKYRRLKATKKKKKKKKKNERKKERKKKKKKKKRERKKEEEKYFRKRNSVAKIFTDHAAYMAHKPFPCPHCVNGPRAGCLQHSFGSCCFYGSSG